MRAATSHVRIGLAAFLALACAVPECAAGGQSVPVPRVIIYAGEKILEAALEDRVLRLGDLPERSWHVRRIDLVGKVARRTLLPGQAIPLNAAKPADVVQSGKQVSLIFALGGLTITGRGLAMQSGGVGEPISVQNQDSGTVVRGIVAADGSVRVGD